MRIVEGVAAIISILAILSWVDTPLQKVLAIICVILLVLALWLTASLASRGRFSSLQVVHTLVVVGLVASAAALLVALRPARVQTITPPTTTAPPPSTITKNTSFKITLPETGVPRCTSFPGEGTIPPDKDLWIVFRDSDGDYWPTTKARPDASPGEWTTDRKELGGSNNPEGTPHHIFAVLLDKETSAYINHLVESEQLGSAKTQPPHAIPVADKVVREGTDHRDCSHSTR
jgi:hypothetical protein